MNFDGLDPDMTLEELREKLKGLGIPHDGWSPAGDKTVQPLRIDKYKALLHKILDLLEGQVEKDKVQISELHAMLQRAQHGGGM